MVGRGSSSPSCPALEGRALQILTDLQPRERLDWQAIQGAFQRRFGHHIDAEGARDKLFSRQRKMGESLGAYLADILLYTCQGYPTFDSAAQEELALQAYIRGLHPGRLQEHIRLAVPQNIDRSAEGGRTGGTGLGPKGALFSHGSSVSLLRQ